MGIGAVNVDVGSVFSGLSDLAKGIREAITGKSILNPDKQADLLAQAQKAESDIVLAQTAINLEEAKSGSVFVAGWRPFIGWVCGSAFAWNFVIGPIAEWIATFFGVATQIPPLDSSVMMPVLLGMLGLGGLRTYEKTKSNGK